MNIWTYEHIQDQVAWGSCIEAVFNFFEDKS